MNKPGDFIPFDGDPSRFPGVHPLNMKQNNFMLVDNFVRIMEIVGDIQKVKQILEIFKNEENAKNHGNPR